MDIKYLRKEFKRLSGCDTISDCIELLDIYHNCLLKLLQNQGIENKDDISLNAKLFLQMILTKAIYLRKSIEGISINNTNCQDLLIDPIMIASMTRNLYEVTSLFNLIYRFTVSVDERKLIHTLWKLSGLNYRQRFGDQIRSQKNIDKLKKEEKTIEELADSIFKSDLYLDLLEHDQEKIKTRIKNKEFMIKFEDNHVKILNWQNLSKTMGIKDALFKNMYTYFSFYSHPSYVSVFQFNDMFDRSDKGYLSLTIVNLKYAFIFLSAFIADYINLFSDTVSIFNSLSLRDQIVIDVHNHYSRGLEYSINDSWKVLED